jgi:GNS1/SUR4 family
VLAQVLTKILLFSHSSIVIMNSSFAQNYRHFFYELADPRSRDLPLMGVPNDFLLALTLSVFFFGFLLPLWLKDVTLKRVKNVTIWVFFIYTMASAVILLKDCARYTYSFVIMRTHEYWNVPEPDESGCPQFCLTFLVLRILQMFEMTFFMMVPSKGFQVKFMIYHHILFPVIIWIIFNFYATSYFAFLVGINVIAHMIISSYKVLCFFIGSIGTTRLKNKIHLYLEVSELNSSFWLCEH